MSPRVTDSWMQCIRIFVIIENKIPCMINLTSVSILYQSAREINTRYEGGVQSEREAERVCCGVQMENKK